MTKRNVLLITADQMRADALAIAGNPHARTPNLDALAREGVRFARHFGQASPCGPSRACLLTGMYLHNHRSVQNGTPLDARFTNIALEARALGYAPALFGYTDTSPDPRGRSPADPALRSYEGVLPGFDPICLMLEDSRPWLAELRRRGHDTSVGLEAIYTPLPARSPSELWGPSRYAAEESDTAFLTDRFLEWHADQNRRWFAHVSYIRPHPPWIAPQPWHDMFDPAAMTERALGGTLSEMAELHPWLAWRLGNQTKHNWVFGREIEPARLSPEEVGQIRATYAALVAEVDHHVGRILQALRDKGELDDTLVIFTSDHGEMLGDHHMLGKESFFPQAFHLPLIVRDPSARTRGAVVEAFTEAVDIMPTVLDWLGGAAPAQCDGRSLLPFLSGEAPTSWRDRAHFAIDFRDVEHSRPETALGLTHDTASFNAQFDGRWLYVHFTALPPVLLDLAGERPLRNVAADPDMAALARDQAMALLSWRMQHDDQVLANMLLTERGPISAGRREPAA